MHLPVGHDKLFKEASLMKKEAQVYGYKNKYLESNSTIRLFNKVTKYSRFYFRDCDLHSHGRLTRIIIYYNIRHEGACFGVGIDPNNRLWLPHNNHTTIVPMGMSCR